MSRDDENGGGAGIDEAGLMLAIMVVVVVAAAAAAAVGLELAVALVKEARRVDCVDRFGCRRLLDRCGVLPTDEACSGCCSVIL